MDANDQSEFSKLTLAQQHEYLQRLRLAVIALTLGDDDMFFRVTGVELTEAPADDSPLPDSADMADAVAKWLAGGVQ